MMKCVFRYLQILALILLASCNPTEQEEVDLGASSLSSATFGYSTSSLELIEDTTDVAIYPDEIFTASYEITPSLPNGLALNTVTGEITGTPTETQTATTYRITAVTSSGRTEVAFITISVLDRAPENISYGTSILSFTKNDSSTSYAPSVTGGTPSTWSANDDLPAGLTLNSDSGVISGTPTVIESKSLQITASNDSGSVTIRVLVSVRPEVPAFDTPTYSTTTQTVNVGTALTNMVPSLTTPLADAKFKIWPALPAGLSIDEDSGVISGTPTERSNLTSYTVTAYNNQGESNPAATLTITATYLADELEYLTDNGIQTNRVVIQKGVPFAMSPTRYVGGTPTTFSVAAALPTGLTLNTATGRISGTPTTFGEVISIIQVDSPDGGAVTETIIFSVSEDFPEDRKDLGYIDSYLFTTYVAPMDHCLNIANLNPDPDITLEQDCKDTANRAWDDANNECVFLEDPNDPTAGADDTSLVTTATTQAACELIADQAWIEVDGDAGSKPSNDGTKPFDAEVVGDDSRDPRYEISPALPEGMLFNGSTGEIMGTPVSAYAETPHTVTGYNMLGDGAFEIETQQTFTIEVKQNIPQRLGYKPTSGDTRFGYWDDTLKVFQVQDGVALEGTGGEDIIYPTIPKGSSLPSVYTVTPRLPDGLSIDSTTGVISGTSTEVLPIKYYTITGTNDAGSVSESIAISTNTITPPDNLTYDGSADGADTINFTIFADSSAAPSYTGGRGTFTLGAGQSLPAGLNMNPSTGEITGVPVVADDPGTYVVNITVTNTEGFDTTTLTIDIQNTAPSGFVIVGTDDYNDGADDDDTILLIEGDNVDNNDIITFSDYENLAGGYINSYTSTLGTINLQIGSDGEVSDIGGTGAIATDAREYNPAAVTYNITVQANNTDGAGGDTSVANADSIDILVIEELPDYDFDNVGNRVLILGGDSDPIVPNQNGGLVATEEGGIAGSFCSTQTTDSLGATTTLEAAVSTDLGVAAGFISFNASDTCEFVPPGAGNCFGTPTSAYSVIVEAKNSGTAYTTGSFVASGAQTGATTTVNVFVGDGPNYEFEPDAANFADETHLTLDGGSGSDSYAPNTAGLCHQGDFNLSELSNLPAPLSFSGTSTGDISITDFAIVGKRSFSLSAQRDISGYELSQEEDITVQANHIIDISGTAAGNRDNHRFKAIKFDLDQDGLEDFFLFDKYCEGTNAAAACTTATAVQGYPFYQSSVSTGVFDGGQSSYGTGSDLDAKAATPILYSTGNVGIIRLNSGGTTVAVDSLTEAATAFPATALGNSGVMTGVMPLSTSAQSSFFVIGEGSANEIEMVKVDLDDPINTATVNAPTSVITTGAGSVAVSDVTMVRYTDMDADGDNDAFVGYIDNVTGNHAFCILGVGTTTPAELSTVCDGRHEFNANEEIREMKFADATGDDLLDLAILTFDTVTNENVIYLFENRNNTAAGFFQNVDTLPLKTDEDFVGFAFGDVNGDENADILAGDIEGVAGLTTGYTIYYNTSTTNIFTDLVSDEGSTAGTSLYYHNTMGSNVEMELLDTGSASLLFHCQTDTDATAPGTDVNQSCGIIGQFNN